MVVAVESVIQQPIPQVSIVCSLSYMLKIINSVLHWNGLGPRE
ncbi:hypothetical protein LINPERPRIM_LOCUS28980 [Linum perenne]